MLSLDHPEIVTFLADAGPGLWPMRIGKNGVALAVKGGSDLAFAAKHKKFLKFHFYRLDIGSDSAVGIITAVYDRTNAPLVIQTVCIDEIMRKSMMKIAGQDFLRIHFFDLHNSELAGGKWKLTKVNDVFPLFQSCTTDIELKDALGFYIALKQKFSNPNDDGLVIEANLVEANMPDNISIIHATEDNVRSRRGEGLGIYQSGLSDGRSPGDAHEAEIAHLLTKFYPAANIVVNPEIEKGKEFCDVLASDGPEAIAIHAKSTVQDEKRFDESSTKRDSRLNKHFRKAVAQARGAERAFYALKKTVSFENVTLGFTPQTKLLIHVIVMYDKSPPLLGGWSRELESFATEFTPVVVFEMSEFVNLLNTNRDRNLFVNALLTIAEDFQRRKIIGEYTFSKGRVAIH